jgi:Zn-dependent peptidase ImmA (M78 family)/DNA-binding XRE family transcriptional regulator
MSFERVNLNALAERLVAARKAAKITQEAAADQLGLSRPTFIAIEKAARRPRPEELVKLAELYNVPLNKMLRDDPRPQQLRPHLRSVLEGGSEGQEGLETATELLTNFIDDYQYLERLLNTKPVTNFPSPVRIPTGPIERFAEHCAQEERARLNLGAHQPIYTLRKVLEEIGIHIFVDRFDSKLAGLYVFVENFGHYILVNRNHPLERRRWTATHEYGHFLADRYTPGVDYLKPMQRKSPSERFADSFTAAFLMPEAGVRRWFYDEVDRTGDFKVSDLFRMADFYSVSMPAMAQRLEAFGLIPRGSWDGIKASRIPVQKLRQETGIDAVVGHDSTEPYPKRYKLLAVQAYLEEKISGSQLAKLLRCSLVEAREIVDACSETADDDDGVPSVVNLPLTRSLLAEAAG